MKFYRNADISISDRAAIGLTAIKEAGIYGTVTDLSEKYGVSRPFVYEIKNAVLSSLKPAGKNKLHAEDERTVFCNKLILTMRLCCKSSIGGISESLKLLNQPNSSTGYVSEFLSTKASFRIEDLPASDKPVTVLADEIFACGQPILVILDARSHFILAIELSEDRAGQTWNKCFAELIKKGYQIKKVAKDLGKGLEKGIEGLDIIPQADLFHLLMKFDPYLGSFERKAFSSIEDEERILNVLSSRKTAQAELKYMEKYFKSTETANGRIKNYDNYYYLHRELHEAFNPFNGDGSFRSRETVTGDVTAILDLMSEEFKKYSGINDACIFLRKHIDEYAPYINEIKNTLEFYSPLLSEFQISEICLSYLKNLKSVAVKNYQTGKKFKAEADNHLNLALAVSGNEQEKKTASALIKRLNECIRSSSPLEAKNSILRKFITSFSGQITQEHLNLITFYMNRKVSIRGKYKGYSPLERFTGTKEELSFLDILMLQA